MYNMKIAEKVAEKVAAIKLFHQADNFVDHKLMISDTNSEITKTMTLPCNQLTFLQLPTGVRKSVHYRVLSFACLTSLLLHSVSISLGLKVNSTGST